MNYVKILLFVVLFLLTTIVSLTFADNQDDFDVIYYSLDVRINPQTEFLEGTVAINAISLIEGLSQLTLDLIDDMIVTSIMGDVSGFVHENNTVVIDLSQNFNQNDTVQVTIFYNGYPSLEEGFNPMTFDRSRQTITISSESCPYYARYWWPCKDRPDDKPKKMDIKITVPSNLVAASNGVLTETLDNGDGTKTYHWQVKNPIATYLVAFSASDFEVINDEYINAQQDTLPIMIFAFPEHYNKALIDFENTKQMIDVLTSYYGTYPYFNEKYGITEYVGYWGGMEYQTLTSLQPSLIQGNHAYETIFVHELAHQWWGDCVTPKTFHHSWISEGFATFSEALYLGHLEGQQKYHDYMNNENNALGIKGIMYRHDISNPNGVYNSIVYNKGAWVLHMLRHAVGEDNFWAGLAEYFSRFKYSSATTEDLQHAFEDVIGDSLEWFFHQWVYEPNYPFYSYGWQQEQDQVEQYVVDFFIDQIQTDAPLFTMPVDITVSTATMETTFVVTVRDSSEMFQLTFSEPVIDLQFDKDDWVLKEAEKITSPILEYFAHQVIDSSGNNNGLAEAEETVDLLVTISNKGLKAKNITARLISSDADILIPPDKAEVVFVDINYPHLAQDLTLPFMFSVTSNAQGHISTFKLEIEADNYYTTIDSFDVKIGNPNVLLVDDDNGADYENFFYQPLSLAKIYIDNWEVINQGIPSFTEVLQKYQTVIWFTGDDRTSTLTSEEQQALAQYVDSGGNLLLTGQDIGFDLVGDGTVDDSLFFANYLHAEYIADTVQSTKLIGVPNDPIGNSLFIYLDPKPDAANNQTSPSAISPINGAVAFLKYIPQMSLGAIRYRDENNESGVVFLSFGFEGISGPYSDSAPTLIKRILDWLNRSGTNVSTKVRESLPQSYSLEQNYPNPFNPTTTIYFQIPQNDHVEISIYNLLGQKIKELVNKNFSAGVHKITWDGTTQLNRQVSSGIYIYKIKTQSFNSSKKMILMR